MAGMTRAHIADPHLVAKLARGEEHRVRNAFREPPPMVSGWAKRGSLCIDINASEYLCLDACEPP